MADDIVTRLCAVLNAGTVEEQQDIIDDAADEIEALRTAGDALAAVMRSGSDAGWDAAIDAWLEARRG